jgi:chromosome segregation ATPase
MSTVDPVSSVQPAPEEPPPAEKKKRNPWKWTTIAVAVIAVGFLVWAVSTQSDLDDLQGKMEQGEAADSAIVAAAQDLYDDLSDQLGATSDDLAETEDDLASAEQAAAKAEADAADAGKQAAEAASSGAKAEAEAEQAKAEAEAAASRGAVAADCAKAYVAAFGELFGGQGADAVQAELDAISEQCSAALADAG